MTFFKSDARGFASMFFAMQQACVSLMADSLEEYLFSPEPCAGAAGAVFLTHANSGKT